MKQLSRVEQIVHGRLFPFLLAFVFIVPASARSQSGPVVIPVVFHIISQNPNAISDQQIIDAVADLNDAFAHTGNYATGAPGANTGIRFCLSKTAPDGGNSTGITRTQSVLSNFDSDIENDKLKKLVSWNALQYCNIWFVEGVQNEYLTQFSCGNWTRRHDIGYGTFAHIGDSLDGIVTKELGPTLAFLMGSYLGLKYTFVQGNCDNTNCNTDGDGVCDTPPASQPGSSCTAIQNTCNTDTLSGFSSDMPDLTSNFMSLSGACVNSFTAGQGAKMRSNLNSARSSLLSGNKCDAPCAENIVAGFNRDNWMPKTGDQVNFTSVSTGGTNYQWSVNGVATGSNSPSYSMTFPAGKTTVSLKVYNANPGCFASYSDDVIVNCGVMARFTPNVRQIASKESILEDSILFTNRSVNATSFQWWMSNDAGMAPQIVSTVSDLNYIFKTPGAYAVWLVAANGSCTDTTEIFSFPVHDPTVDGTVSLRDVQCYQQTKIMVTLVINNTGYAPIPTGTPVTFYDADPRNPGAHKLSPVFLTTSPVAGICRNGFSTMVDIDTPGLNKLYVVFNDNGNSIPLVLPNTALPESSYINNIDSQTNFQFRVHAFPDSATLQPGDTVHLGADFYKGPVTSWLWSSEKGLNCTQCENPYFTAEDSVYSITKKLLATSTNGCLDSSFVILHIPPANDFQVTIDSLNCAGNDSLHAGFTICNNFIRGKIPKGLRVSFYDADPAGSDAHLLGPVFVTDDSNPATCASFGYFINRPASARVFAEVNSKDVDSLGLPGNFYAEAKYDNNEDTASVTPFLVSISPSDTSIVRLNSVQLIPQFSGGYPTTYQWEPAEYLSCSDCPSPVATPPSRVEYRLTVQNEFACTATASASIKIFSGGKVNIPNGFTPNNDGLNDVFYVLASEEVKMIKDFSVFNRWGQKVFQTTNAQANDPKSGWNGLLNGKPAETGSYVYFITIAFTNGSTEVYKGTVTLIR